MVESVSNLSRSGLRDFILQRSSAVILASYILFLVGYCAMHSSMYYDDWEMLFGHTTMKIFTLLALLSLIVHAYIGVWTIITDYIKCTCLRSGLIALLALGLLSCLIWGTIIVWSV